MTVFIRFTGSDNFRVILTLLQPQLSPDDDIYVVDTTPDRRGVRLAKLYGSTRCYIFVEVGDYDDEKALSFAMQNMVENKQDGLLKIDENCVISQTFIANMRKVKGYNIVSPVIIETPYPAMPSDFRWYNKPGEEVNPTEYYSEKCFLVFCGSGDKCGMLTSEVVVILPNKST